MVTRQPNIPVNPSEARRSVDASFWAIDKCDGISEVCLDTRALQNYAPDAWHYFEELMHLANSIRSLQQLDGSFVSHLAQDLLGESAKVLREAARSIDDEEVAHQLRLRADGLMIADTREAAVHLVACENNPLIVLCGPLVTWPSKSNAYLHSAVVALEDADATRQLRHLESKFPELKEYYEDMFELRGVRLNPVPSFSVADLAFCGGEANGFPKHFSYFLPEDEGYKGEKDRKTIVFRNIYTERLRCLSLPLLESICGGLTPEIKAQVSDPFIALTWFRGHDIGHFWRHERTNFKALRAIGQRPSYALQEALSDVLGYLAMLGPWRPAAASDTSLMFFYLSEMVRFLSRQENIHYDFPASYLVLNYLYRFGFISIDTEACQIAADPESFNRGIRQLAKRLFNTILGGDVAEAHNLARAAGLLGDVYEDTLTKLLRAVRNNDIRYRIVS